MVNDTDQNVLTVKEAADFCMVSPETIRRWIRNEDLVAYNTQGRGVMKVKLSDLKSFVGKHNILTVVPE
jgi:excisionase family DNA binding protein